MTQPATIVEVSLLDETGDSYHRMRWPAKFLAEQSGWRVVSVGHSAPQRLALAQQADLLVLLHCGDREMIPVIHDRKSRGLKTLIEINDNFYEPQAWNPAKAWWSSPEAWKTYEEFMNLADGVLVSGPGLVKLLSPKVGVKKIHSLPNHLPDEMLPKSSARKKDSQKIRVGWAGSAGHLVDLLSIEGVLKKCLQKFPQLQVCLMGDPTLPQYLSLPPARCEYVPFGNIFQYFDFLKTLDVGLIPLLDTPYNRCRSDIKAVEMGGAEILPIIQRNLCYEEFLKKTGAPSFDSLEELEAILGQLLSDPPSLTQPLERVTGYIQAQRSGRRDLARKNLYEKFLPKKISGYAWPMPMGHTEIRAHGFLKPAEPPKLTGELTQIRQLAQENPYDLRYPMYLILFEADDEKRFSLWKDFFVRVKNSPQAHADALVPDLLRGLQREKTRSLFYDQILFLMRDCFSYRLAGAEEGFREALTVRDFGRALRDVSLLQEARDLLEYSQQDLQNLAEHSLEIWSAYCREQIKSESGGGEKERDVQQT